MAGTGEILAKAMAGAWAEAQPGLPRSTSAFTGACPRGAPTPRQVLIFARNSAAALLRGARKSFQHRRFVLIANAGGAGDVGVDGVWARLEPGEALLVFPYQVHTYGRLPRTGLRWIFVTFEADAPAEWETLRGRALPLPAEAWGWLGVATRSWREHGTEAEDLAHWAGLVAGALRRAALRKPGRVAPGGAEAPLARGGSWLPRVHAAVHRPEGALWRVKDLARALNVSGPHLRAMFRAEAGVSLGAWLRRVRMARATALLTAGGVERLKVGEVARLCGYDTPYSFSRAFRRTFGRTARDYRRGE